MDRVNIYMAYKAECFDCGASESSVNHQVVVGWAEEHKCAEGVVHVNVFDEPEKNGAAMDPHWHREGKSVS